MSWNNDDNTDDLDLGFDLDATEAQEAKSFDLLKKGDYPAIITGATPKAGKREGVRYVAMEVTIIAGPAKGRKVWGNFTTHNVPRSNSAEDAKKAATATNIGRGHIKSAFLAAEVTSSSPIDLVEAQTPLVVVVGIEKGTDGHEDKNNIRGFKPMAQDHRAALEAGDDPTPAPAVVAIKPAGKKPGFLRK